MNGKEEQEKPVKNAHLVGKKVITVQAIRDGFFGDSKVIQGEVFKIREKKGFKRINKYSDHTEEVVVTVAQQFSRFWMVELESGDDEEHKLHNEQIKEVRATQDKLRARDSQASEDSLPQQPVKKAPLPKKKATKKKKKAQSKIDKEIADIAPGDEPIVVDDGDVI